MKKYKKGITFGAFDLFHMGHFNLIRNAKAQCNLLIAVVSTDEYIWSRKGKPPRLPFEFRKKILEHVHGIDCVSYQSSVFTKKDNIELFSPDVIFVGDDWTPETFEGEGLGVPVIYLPYTKGISTTLIAK